MYIFYWLVSIYLLSHHHLNLLLVAVTRYCTDSQSGAQWAHWDGSILPISLVNSRLLQGSQLGRGAGSGLGRYQGRHWSWGAAWVRFR